MAWTKILKSYFKSDEPMISLNNSRFSFNSVFSKIVDIEKNQFVTYYVDEDNWKLGFEFKDIEDQNSFKVVLNKKKGNYSQSTELFSKNWIRKISKLKDINRFKPSRDGKKYVISLMPVFENSFVRENYLTVPADTEGIYRYLDNGNIVYIGKGNIRSRLKEISRQDWKFDTIEYSKISNAESQLEWESYWIERFKYENDNKFPSYNLISGKFKKIIRD